MQRKKWQEPKLIILVRGKPEEDVLCVCKNIIAECTIGGPSTGVSSNCNSWNAGLGHCYACDRTNCT